MIDKVRTPSLKELVPLEIIAGQVALYHGVDEHEIFKRSRGRETIDMRYEFFGLARKFNKANISFQYIGAYCEERFGIKAFDHASVIHGIRMNQNHCETMPARLEEYNRIAENIIVVANSSTCNEFLKLKTNVIKSVMKSKSREDLKQLLKDLEL